MLYFLCFNNDFVCKKKKKLRFYIYVYLCLLNDVKTFCYWDLWWSHLFTKHKKHITKSVFNKWWGRCCNRPSVGVCVLTINVHELHAWKKDKDKKKKRKKLCYITRRICTHYFSPSRNASCQRALLGSRISRTHWCVLFFHLMNKVPSDKISFFVFWYPTFHFNPFPNHCFLMLCHFQSDRNV